MSPRNLTLSDRIVGGLDRGLRTVLGGVSSGRENPARDVEDGEMSAVERRAAIGLMRVNHAGEVSAQALYQGQAVTARKPEVRSALAHAAEEENDHLVWCRSRLEELGGATSLLDPVWYAGSFAIGALAGLFGDRASLGFLVETERQVVEHLDGHLERLPTHDERSRVILEQMRTDEHGHATSAADKGAGALPSPIRSLMRLSARIMTRSAYWI